MASAFAKLPGKVVTIATKLGCDAVKVGRPALAKFFFYARTEMRPPSLSDFGTASTEAKHLVQAAKIGKWKNISVKEGFLNAVVATEVLMWLFIGEVIGRRSIIGYSRVPGAYIKAH